MAKNTILATLNAFCTGRTSSYCVLTLVDLSIHVLEVGVHFPCGVGVYRLRAVVVSLARPVRKTAWRMNIAVKALLRSDNSPRDTD